LVLKKNAYFSPKIVIITSTPRSWNQFSNSELRGRFFNASYELALYKLYCYLNN
jgi:hypothetical protein